MAFKVLGMTSVELSISEGRVGIEERRLPNLGEADGETEGVTLLTGVKEFGVGEEEEALAERELLAPLTPPLLLLLTRKLSFLLGVVGVAEDAVTPR